MTSQEAIVELALDAHCDLGEGPIYDDRLDILYFVDINRNTIHAYKTSDGSHTTLELTEPIGAVALTTDPDLLIAATGRHILLIRFWTSDSNSSRGVISTIAETPESHGIADMRFNDCKVSPKGALIAGRMHSAWRKPGNRGRLYSLDPGSKDLREILSPDHVGLPNGMAWTPDALTCYFVDSAEETITAYTTDAYGAPDAATAKVISRKPTGHKHVPDGMTIDAEGKLWVVLGESGSVVQIDPENGDELQRVALPVKRPTSCGFGGPGLEWLYVTTRVESGEGASENHGGLFRVKIPGIKGGMPDGKFAV